MHDYENKGMMSLSSNMKTGEKYFGFEAPEVDAAEFVE